MKEKIFAKIDELKDQMIQDICEMVQIDSQRSEPQEGMPFGQGVNNALTKALEISKREGLSVKNVDGYMGYAQFGEGENYIGFMGHLDVVAVGDGWIYPPFSATIADNRIWGRGALDNKGPLFSAFYGMLALKKLGIEPNIPIRVIFGTNEETGMADCRYYLEHEKAPLMGFTPDNKFPAIYGERGRAVIAVTGKKEVAVPFINEYFMNAKPNGDRLGINYKDEHFGEMIIRGKQLIEDGDDLGIRFSLSYPTCDIDEVIAKIKSKAGDMKVEVISNSPVVLHERDCWLVQTISDAYAEAMGGYVQPTTTTGGTYAHVCQTIIPYGPSFPGQNGIAHQPNEWMDIDDLVTCAKVYAWTLYRLCQMDQNIEPWSKTDQ